MIIIGEKLNGSIPPVAAAIAARDADFIRRRAIDQTNAGATYLDVCASVPEAEEGDVLAWMISLVQEVSDLPICIDSPSARACVDAMRFCRKPGMINSVSMEDDKADVIFPAIAGTEWQCVGLLCAKGIPSSAAARMDVFHSLLGKMEQYGIQAEKMYIDPLVEMVCTSQNGVIMLLDVIRGIKAECPAVHVTGAVSNVSFNLPSRKTLNLAFLAVAMAAGLDSAVLDPCSRDMMGMICATEAMLGKDMFCIQYLNAFRAGRFGKTN